MAALDALATGDAVAHEGGVGMGQLDGHAARNHDQRGGVPGRYMGDVDPGHHDEGGTCAVDEIREAMTVDALWLVILRYCNPCDPTVQYRSWNWSR